MELVDDTTGVSLPVLPPPPHAVRIIEKQRTDQNLNIERISKLKVYILKT
jgi:hypothetical protein